MEDNEITRSTTQKTNMKKYVTRYFFLTTINVKSSALKQRNKMSKNYLMEEARKVANDMLDTKSIVEPVKTWGDGNTLFVSIDKNAIYSTQTFILEGKRFFIGARLQKET